MYPHFITVHDNDNGDPFLVNIDHIISIGKEGMILTGVPAAIALATTESFDELKQLVSDAGCHIEKADPRLNTAKPLTMDELRQMVGEPVWNSNTRSWGLVCDYYDETVAIKPPRGASYDYDADDLVKFPLYRMKEG